MQLKLLFHAQKLSQFSLISHSHVSSRNPWNIKFYNGSQRVYYTNCCFWNNCINSVQWQDYNSNSNCMIALLWYCLRALYLRVNLMSFISFSVFFLLHPLSIFKYSGCKVWTVLPPIYISIKLKWIWSARLLLHLMESNMNFIGCPAFSFSRDWHPWNSCWQLLSLRKWWSELMSLLCWFRFEWACKFQLE